MGEIENDAEIADRLAALYELIAMARGDHICKRCKGAGELGDDPDDYTPCPDCDGEGEIL